MDIDHQIYNLFELILNELIYGFLGLLQRNYEKNLFSPY
jgi:hypothetical protein